MTTTATNLTLSFESKVLAHNNANIPFQERIFAQLLRKPSCKAQFWALFGEISTSARTECGKELHGSSGGNLPQLRRNQYSNPLQKSANSLTQPPQTHQRATNPPRLAEHLRNFSSMSRLISYLGEDGVQQRQSDTNCLILTTFP